MKHEFDGDNISISYDDEVCIHAKNCLHILPAVFDAKRSPWIDPNGAGTEDAVAAVKACPSGALQYQLK